MSDITTRRASFGAQSIPVEPNQTKPNWAHTSMWYNFPPLFLIPFCVHRSVSRRSKAHFHDISASASLRLARRVELCSRLPLPLALLSLRHFDDKQLIIGFRTILIFLPICFRFSENCPRSTRVRNFSFLKKLSKNTFDFGEKEIIWEKNEFDDRGIRPFILRGILISPGRREYLSAFCITIDIIVNRRQWIVASNCI